ncbi:VOC family protein [Salinimicrobium sp. GXAS 041]|uniref:VOC family protein n=1 Tax=Salinimicrobium sp. GXAS 041 TaxID=3400806 RepID=UPI003C7250E1
MIRTCLPVMVLLFAHVSSAQNGFNFNKDHDALQVKDLSISADFYKNILGLEEIPNGGLPNHIRWFPLNDKVQIHLIESVEEIKKHKGVHMALNVDDLSGLMDHLRKQNVHFENWEGEGNTTNDRPDGVKQIYFQDPDGYWIEVNDGNL